MSNSRLLVNIVRTEGSHLAVRSERGTRYWRSGRGEGGRLRTAGSRPTERCAPREAGNPEPHAKPLRFDIKFWYWRSERGEGGRLRTAGSRPTERLAPRARPGIPNHPRNCSASISSLVLAE
jgi:hypothetical protein